MGDSQWGEEAGDSGRRRRKKFWEELFAYETDRMQNNASNKSPIVASVFVAAVTLPNRCLGMIRDTYIDTDLLKVFT
jgi:hypothetical protein